MDLCHEASVFYQVETKFFKILLRRASGMKGIITDMRSRCSKKVVSPGCATNALQSVASCHQLCCYELQWLHLAAHSQVVDRRTVCIWHTRLETEYDATLKATRLNLKQHVLWAH